MVIRTSSFPFMSVLMASSCSLLLNLSCPKADLSLGNKLVRDILSEKYHQDYAVSGQSSEQEGRIFFLLEITDSNNIWSCSISSKSAPTRQGSQSRRLVRGREDWLNLTILGFLRRMRIFMPPINRNLGRNRGALGSEQSEQKNPAIAIL